MEPNITFPPDWLSVTSAIEQALWIPEAEYINKYMTGLGEDSTVLDLACGHGFASDYVAKQYGCKVLGVDILPEMVAWAREKYGNNKVEFVTGDMCDPDVLADRLGSFSWVMCHHGIHHVTDPEGFLQTCYRAAKEDGHLLNVSLTREFGHPEVVAALRRTLEDPKWQAYKHQVEAANKSPLKSLTPEDYPWILDTQLLFQMIEKNGFRIIQKEVRKLDVVVTLTNEFVRAVIIAVKAVPEERQDEFVEDIMQAARALSGEQEPRMRCSTVVVHAQKSASSISNTAIKDTSLT